jgi:hypothetical protein
VSPVNIDNNIIDNKSYVLPQYRVHFDEELATKYKPIVYSHECLSDDPEAIYYRIVAKDDTREICIQYFFYWAYQSCMMASHRYDYEPIFIYLKEGSTTPHMIVNGGLGGPECGFHKNEIRPSIGERSEYEVPISTKMCPTPYYPFGKDGNVECTVCCKIYPLSGGRDLQFEQQHPRFGIRACSNVFSGAIYDLNGKIFDPQLKQLTDEVLKEWYCNHYNNRDDMPFGHDVADPFSCPYIKYRSAREELPCTE